MSANRRKYKFNVIAYLWYMGKDSWRVPLRRWPSPFEALANCLIIIPLIFCGFYFGAIYPQYSKYIFISFVIGAFATSFSCDFLLKKYRFTEERERAYFRRYPERKHYSIKMLFWFPFIIMVMSFIIFGIVFLFFLKSCD